LLGSVALLLIALFMFVGFLRSGAGIAQGSTILALLITVGLPAAGGLALAAGHYGNRARLTQRKDRLRQQTVESEILRLATERDGRLTVVEVVSELALPLEAVKETLDSLVTRDVADIQITDSGLLVYTFHDIRHLGQKPQAKGVLDA
jgi:hypothetical protein